MSLSAQHQHVQILLDILRDIKIYMINIQSLTTNVDKTSETMKQFVEQVKLNSEILVFLNSDSKSEKLPKLLTQLESIWNDLETSIKQFYSIVTNVHICDILTKKKNISYEDLCRLQYFLEKVKLTTLICVSNFKELDNVKKSICAQVLELENTYIHAEKNYKLIIEGHKIRIVSPELETVGSISSSNIPFIFSETASNHQFNSLIQEHHQKDKKKTEIRTSLDDLLTLKLNALDKEIISLEDQLIFQLPFVYMYLDIGKPYKKSYSRYCICARVEESMV